VRRAEVLVHVDSAFYFVPASIALRVASPPRITPIPGASPELLGVALCDGVIVPVIAIGPERREMIVCQHAGELVGLVGGKIVHTGTFDVVPGRLDTIEYEGRRAESIDLAAIYGKAQAGARPGRWAR
jgi:hypothetical protein